MTKTYSLTDQQLDRILDAMSYRPWREVNDLMQTLAAQANQTPQPVIDDGHSRINDEGPAG